MQEKGFTKFELILGLASLAVVVLVVMPPLHGGMSQEKITRAVTGAEDIARAILDYRSDTGTWPGQMGNNADKSCLTRPMQTVAADQGLIGTGLVGTLGEATRPGQGVAKKADFCPWLNEVPLDPWHRPYRVAVMAFSRAHEGDADTYRQDASTRTGVYPIEPPAGVAICVVSAGPDGEWSTDLAQLDKTAGAGSTQLKAGTVTPIPSAQFGGDDLGFVLRGSAPGGES